MISTPSGSGAAAVESVAAPGPGERISGAELRVWLDWLGLRQGDAARVLNVAERTLRAWLTGRDPIPVRVGDELAAFDGVTAGIVDQVVDALRSAADPAVVIYRDDAQMRAAAPVSSVPIVSASWWRMVVARATVEVPGVEIRYVDEVRPRE